MTNRKFKKEVKKLMKMERENPFDLYILDKWLEHIDDYWWHSCPCGMLNIDSHSFFCHSKEKKGIQAVETCVNTCEFSKQWHKITTHIYPGWSYEEYGKYFIKQLKKLIKKVRHDKRN